MIRTIASTLAAALSVATLAAPAVGRETALDGLTALCRDDGRPAAECACLRGFVSDNFSAREIEGAWIVFSDPALESSPPQAIRTLLARGYTMPEIVDVFERVSSLDSEAKATCTAETAATAQSPAPATGATATPSDG